MKLDDLRQRDVEDGAETIGTSRKTSGFYSDRYAFENGSI